MSEANEFVVVKVGDKRRSIDNLGGTIHANPGEAEVNFILRVQAAYGGEWDGTSDSIGWRYRRKPSESPAERVARELWSHYHMGKDDFIAFAVPLIAAVAEPTACPECQRDKAAMHCEWCCLEVRQAVKDRTAELEAKLKDCRRLLADYTQENESYRDERDHWRQRWEQLRDSVAWRKDPGAASVLELLKSAESTTLRINHDWARQARIRLESALKEPEAPNVA